jgi:hypothetical protein
LAGQVNLAAAQSRFLTRRHFAGGRPPPAVAVADFNGDGKLDMLVTNGFFSGGIAGVFLGKGDGTFEVPMNLPVATTSPTVDHKLDVAIAIRGGVEVLLEDRNGTFQSPIFISYNNSGNRYPEPGLH